jgi:protease IV
VHPLRPRPARVAAEAGRRYGRAVQSILRALLNVVGFILWCLRRPWAARRLKVPWVWVPVAERIEELPRDRPGLPARLLARRSTNRVASVHALAAIVRDLERAAPELGLILHVRGLSGGWATLESLRSQLVRARSLGRPIVVYLEEGADQRTLFVASAASEVWLGPAAGVTALGPVSRRTYIAPLLRRLGIQVATSAAGDYKSAADGLVRDGMSEPDRAQRSGLLAAVLARWSDGVGERVGAAAVSTAVTEAVLSPERARSLGLVDRVGYLDELEATHGIAPTAPALGPQALRGPLAPYRFRPVRARPHLAVVRLVGPIGGTGPGIALRETRSLLRRLRQRNDVVGVVLFVDSPGGAAVASDLIHREVELLAREKPVHAVFGDVAASGGYYIAAPAQRIWARATSVTGSIGVISVRAAFAELIERAGVRVESLAATPAADLFRLTTPLRADEAALLEAETARFYARFVDVVAAGRRRTREQVLAVAGGRVWAGIDALSAGLVDALGGLPDALAELASELAPTKGALGEPVVYAAASAPGGLVGALRGVAADAEPNVASVWSGLELLRATEHGPLAWAP